MANPCRKRGLSSPVLSLRVRIVPFYWSPNWFSGFSARRFDRPDSTMSQLRSGSGAGEGSRTLDILLGKYKQLATKLHFVAKESVHIVLWSPYCIRLLSPKLPPKFESPRRRRPRTFENRLPDQRITEGHRKVPLFLFVRISVWMHRA